VDTQAQPIVEEFGGAIIRRDFARHAELLDDDLSYELCGIEAAGAGVFDKPPILVTLPRMLSVFEAGGSRMRLTKAFYDGDRGVAGSTAAPPRPATGGGEAR
jgi:hypothetical protein